MKEEYSAGGVVYKKEGGNTFILVGKHSGHKGWVFPKGWIEKGESKEETAVREVREEGGIEARITQTLPEVTFFFQLHGRKIKKTVSYFLMEYVSGDPEDHDWEMETVIWVPQDQVLDKVTYPTDKKTFQEALKYLS